MTPEVNLPSAGFVGLGIMGTPMASHLHRAGYRLALHDLDLDRARQLAATLGGPAQAVDTPRAVAQRSDIVIAMLPDGAVVQSVALQWAPVDPKGRDQGVECRVWPPHGHGKRAFERAFERPIASALPAPEDSVIPAQASPRPGGGRNPVAITRVSEYLSLGRTPSSHPSASR